MPIFDVVSKFTLSAPLKFIKKWQYFVLNWSKALNAHYLDDTISPLIIISRIKENNAKNKIKIRNALCCCFLKNVENSKEYHLISHISDLGTWREELVEALCFKFIHFVHSRRQPEQWTEVWKKGSIFNSI